MRSKVVWTIIRSSTRKRDWNARLWPHLVFLVHDLLACLEDHTSEVVLVSIELGHEGSSDGTNRLFLALQVVNFGANQIRVRLEKLQSLLQGNLIACAQKSIVIKKCLEPSVAYVLSNIRYLRWRLQVWDPFWLDPLPLWEERRTKGRQSWSRHQLLVASFLRPWQSSWQQGVQPESRWRNFFRENQKEIQIQSAWIELPNNKSYVDDHQTGL